MKKVLIGIFAIVLIVAMAFYIEPSWSDSGWDTGYGGSSSSHSSSSHSSSRSSSRSSSSRSRSSSSSSGSGDPVAALVTVFFIMFFFIGLWIILPTSSTKSNPVVNDIYFDMDIQKLQHILPNETLESLKTMAVNKFIEIQNAWMNFDYDTLKRCCSDELYNTYKEQLEVLAAKNQKNIMSNFKTIKICILDVIESEKYVNVQVFLKIAFYDYVVDAKGNVLHGNKNSMIMNHYKLNFIRFKDTKAKFCSSCGAEITDPAAKVCPYCRSKIVVPPGQFVLSKKTNDGTVVL